MTDRRRCGAHVWRCPACDHSVAKAIVRRGGRCPRPGCEEADEPFESTCRVPIADGARRCRMHGKESPQALAAQEQRKAADEARADLARLGVPVETTPLDALDAMLWESAGNVAALRLLVGDRDTPLGVNRFGENVVHPLTALYGDERDRLARIAKDCAGLGLDERRVKVAEAHTTRLFDAVSRALSAIPAKHRDAFKVALAAELRAG